MSEQTAPSRKRAPQLADYPHRVREIVRYGDLDPQGHANNALFATYFESGRVAMFRARDLGIGVPNATFALARQEIDFLRELHWQDEIVVGTAVVAFGRTSFTLAQAIFHAELCAAAGRAVMVTLEATTRKPQPLPPEIAAQLEPWRYRGEG
jgi:acyl-CoA thioester hydrolase